MNNSGIIYTEHVSKLSKKLSDCSLSLRCNHVSEIILHSFCQCDQVKHFWETIKKYLVEKINFKIKFTDFIIICGYPLHDKNNIPINTLIIVTKKYIFETSKLGSRLNMSVLKHKLCQISTDECLLSKIGKEEEKFFQNLALMASSIFGIKIFKSLN